MNPSAAAVSGLPAYASVNEIDDVVDVAIVAVPAESVQDVVLDCAAKGVHGLVVISSGFAETGEEGRQRQRRLVGLSRSYGLRLIGPNALGIINTDPAVSINASLAGLMPPRGRAGFFCQSGALGSAILEKVNNRGSRALDVRQRRQPGRRVRQRPAAVLGGGRLHRGRDDVPRVDRQPAQVLPDRPPGLAAQADHRGAVRPDHPGRADGARRPHDRRAAARRWTRCSARPGSSRSTPSRTCSTSPSCSPTSRCRRGRRVAIVGNSDALGLLAADAAAAVGLVVNKQVALDAEPSAEDFEDALDTAIDDPEVDAVVAVYIPPLDVPGEHIANVLAAVGEQSDKPLVSTFLGAQGVPELLRVPDVAGSTAGRGSVPSYHAVEAAVRALARVVEYAVWLRTPDGRPADPAGGRRRRGPPGRGSVLAREPRRRRAQPGGADRPAGGVRHRPVGLQAGAAPAPGPGGRPGAGLGRHAQGHGRAPPRAPRPRARLAQHRRLRRR